MEKLLDPKTIAQVLQEMQQWLFANVLVWTSLAQLAAIFLAYVVAFVAAPRLRKIFGGIKVKGPVGHRFEQVGHVVGPLTMPLIWLLLQSVAVVAAGQAGKPFLLMKIVVSLLAAWVVIRLLASFIKDPTWSRTISVTAWTVAALNIVGLLEPTMALLDGIAFSMGEMRVSVLGLAKGVLILGLFLWFANLLSRFVERRMSLVITLTPSLQVLFGKMVRFGLYAVAILVGLNSIGIDFTALAVFSGAVGLGIGLGLQKVFSNLVSGIILLLEKSVKPGDVIAVGDTYGWINKLSARYVSVITRDSIEHLIPNEELIGQRVENWSYSSNDVRMRLPLGISYDDDPRQAIALCKEAADENPRVLADPPPNCLVRGFGDSSVDLELRVWIADPVNGMGNIRSDLYLSIWDKFKESGISIPYPQRDIHIKSGSHWEGMEDAGSGSKTAAGSGAGGESGGP